MIRLLTEQSIDPKGSLKNWMIWKVDTLTFAHLSNFVPILLSYVRIYLQNWDEGVFKRQFSWCSGSCPLSAIHNFSPPPFPAPPSMQGQLATAKAKAKQKCKNVLDDRVICVTRWNDFIIFRKLCLKSHSVSQNGVGNGFRDWISFDRFARCSWYGFM